VWANYEMEFSQSSIITWSLKTPTLTEELLQHFESPPSTRSIILLTKHLFTFVFQINNENLNIFMFHAVFELYCINMCSLCEIQIYMNSILFFIFVKSGGIIMTFTSQ
jgi:hypothetical protein